MNKYGKIKIFAIMLGVLVFGLILFRLIAVPAKLSSLSDESLASILKPNLEDRTELGPKFRVSVDSLTSSRVISTHALEPRNNLRSRSHCESLLQLHYSGKLLRAKIQNGLIETVRLDSADMLWIESGGLVYHWSYQQANGATAVVSVLISRATEQVVEVSYELWGD